MTNLTKWAATLTIKRLIKKIDTGFALLTLSCFKSFFIMSRYYCQSHCWNIAQTPFVLFFALAVLNFCPKIRKPCFFCILLCNLAYLMGECVRCDIRLCWRFDILILCKFFVCTFCMCYFLRLFRLWSIRQTPASKSCLTFNFKILTKPCAQSLKKV